MAIIRTINLEIEDEELINKWTKKGFNFSDWVREMIRENLADREWWEDKKNKFVLEVDDRIKDLAKIKRDEEVITKEEIDFLKETREIIKIYPEYLNGKIIEYMDKFSKKIGKNKFIDLLNDYDENKVKKLKRLEYWIREIKPKCKMLSNENCKWTSDVCNIESCRLLKEKNKQREIDVLK